MIMGKMIGGGVEAVVMNYYRHIDRSKFQFDFIIDNDSTVIPQEEIETLGGRIYKVAPYQNISNFTKSLKNLFKMNNYKIVHSHMNSLSVFPLRVAKQCDIPIRIAHNHSTAAPGENKKNIIKYLLRLFATRYPTHYMSPTRYAGEWLFGHRIADQDLFILKNAIDIEKFAFNGEIRNKVRNQLGYKVDDFIIGNIGRLVWQKNQFFLIQVFSEIRKNNSDAKLLIIGDGPEKKNLMKLINESGLNKSAKIISNTSNIADFYQAMDFFVFPSNYEGLGMVAIEAQVSGLRVLGSKCVPRDVKITDLYKDLELNLGPLSWSGNIYRDSIARKSHLDEAIVNGYRIEDAVIGLEKFYQNSLEEVLF